MSRQLFVCREVDGEVKLCEIDLTKKRPWVNAPYVKGDEMLDGVMSMTGSGKTYYSKSELRAEYKRMGYEEIGNDTSHLTAPKESIYTDKYVRELERDVAESIEQVRYNQAPLSEFDRERCKIINHQIENSTDTRIREDAEK